MLPEPHRPPTPRESDGSCPAKLPTGLVTLLFTDIEGSVALKQQLGDLRGARLIQAHHELVRQTLRDGRGGKEIETAGDSFLIMFTTPSEAVMFALRLQGRLRELNREQAVPVLDRLGIHLGEVVIREHPEGLKPRDLYGSNVDICARMMSLAKANQILMSRGVFDSARQVLKGEDIEGIGVLEWLNHGLYLLKGIEEPVEVCEVREAGQAQPPGPPTSSEKAQRQVRANEEPVLGWRPAIGQAVPDTRWVLERKLGEGGFGEVWLGRNTTTKQATAFKFCFEAERVRFLKRELTLFRLLKDHVGHHLNIVGIHDVCLEKPPFYVEMDYVEGEDLGSWCREHGGVTAIPLEARLEIVAQAADGLQAAHGAGVIHRDIKPANILIADCGLRTAEFKPKTAMAEHGIGGAAGNPQSPIANQRSQISVKLTDFGIGQVVSEEYLKGITRAGFTQTMAGSSSSGTGTQLYMAPELLAGQPASIRSDIYSLGVLLYQLLVGDFKRPVTTDWANDIADASLRDDLQHCFAGNPNDRFTSARQLAQRLRSLPERRAELDRQAMERAAVERAAHRRGVMRKVGVALAFALLLILGTTLSLWQARRAGQAEKERSSLRNVRWALETALPEIEQLLGKDNNTAAFKLLEQARPLVEDNPRFQALSSRVVRVITIRTTPPGADVFLRDYSDLSPKWDSIGRSPLNELKVPRGFKRWRVVLPGYEGAEGALWTHPKPVELNVQLDQIGAVPPGMVRIRGGKSQPSLDGLDARALPELNLPDYLFDKYEVTNRRYKAFIEAGGYKKPEYWKHQFIKDGIELSWLAALKLFVDQTGQPGPATWKHGDFPNGQGDYPVGGVSWYEAAAYAEFAGKRLPTVYHWGLAALIESSNPDSGIDIGFVIPLSNFGGKGPAPVGQFQGMSVHGIYDMAGNVKEWCFNASSEGYRWNAGGGWNEPQYLFSEGDASSPLFREAHFGFRCMKLLTDDGVWEKAACSVKPHLPPGLGGQKPCSDEVFQAYKKLYDYNRSALQPIIDAREDLNPYTRREKVSFNAAYGNERMSAYLYLPRTGKPPFQTVLYWPGSSASDLHSIEEYRGYKNTFESHTRAGRAFVFPVLHGTFERMAPPDKQGKATALEEGIMWAKDFKRTIDYLETRPGDFDTNKLAFEGLSWGGVWGGVYPAIDTRIKAAVMLSGGLWSDLPTEYSQVNFAPRIKIPILLQNGRYDFDFPVESNQKPYLRLFGTAEKDKCHRTYETGHAVWVKDEVIKDEIDFLNQYLGPVN